MKIVYRMRGLLPFLERFDLVCLLISYSVCGHLLPRALSSYGVSFDRLS